MAIWGEQWDCRCGWSNVFVRRKCRNCGALSPDELARLIAEKRKEVDAVIGPDPWPLRQGPTKPGRLRNQ